MYNQTDLLELLGNINSMQVLEEFSQDFKEISYSESININSGSILDDNLNQILSESSNSRYYLFPNLNGRASTAPIKLSPNNLNWNFYIPILENCVRLYEEMKPYKEKVINFSADLCEICKKFFEEYEKLVKILRIEITSRDYFIRISKSFNFNKKTNCLCYLIEKKDSTQVSENFLYLNGKKYILSNNLMESGENLIKSLSDLLLNLKTLYSKSKDDIFFGNSQNIYLELKSNLLNFDRILIKFEELYEEEITKIENDSKKLIIQAIQIEKELTGFEVRAKCLGKILIDSEDYNLIRKRLVDIMSEINQVANLKGKGRGDLNIAILTEAESIMRRISSTQCKVIRFLAEKIKESFMEFRLLLRKYDENIENIDPHLKNNPELVDCMVNYEINWEKGQEFLLSPDKCNQLIDFSQIIEILCEKYKEINEQVLNRDQSVFIWIPSIVILNSLDNETENKICQEFNPSMFNLSTESGKLYKDLKELYKNISKRFEDSFVLYNILEKSILFEMKSDLILESQFVEFDHLINVLTDQLKANKPLDWKEFIELSMKFL